MSNVTTGPIVKISGPIIDVKFTPGLQPPIGALLKRWIPPRGFTAV